MGFHFWSSETRWKFQILKDKHYQITNFKLQITNKFKIKIYKIQNGCLIRRRIFTFVIWILFVRRGGLIV